MVVFAHRYPRGAAAIAAAGIAASVVLPPPFGGRVRGIIGLSWREPDVCNAEEQALLEALAAQAAQALERARLFDAEHRAARRPRR